jgi:hypothetical protein
MRMVRTRLALLLVPFVFACKPKHEGDVPLHVTNAPKCAAGHTLARQVVVRMENGSDFVLRRWIERDELMFHDRTVYTSAMGDTPRSRS